MKTSFSSLLLSTVSIAILACSNTASAANASKAEIEATVKEVIHDNPELIAQSLADYQKKKEAEATAKAIEKVVELQKQLKNDATTPSVGNPKGDVTIVEFFDYHCGYCKKFMPIITKMTEDDGNLRLVFKEFPILSEDSALAAKAALVVNSIDKSKYLPFHMALMKMTTEFTADNLTEKAKSVGIDEAAFKKGMANPAFDRQIAENKELGASLNIHGTPAIVIGDQVVPGVMPMSELKAKIIAARIANKS